MKNRQSLLAAIFASTVIEAQIDHPNELKFTGTLVRLDEASTKAPNGSQGHRILIPKALAERKYKTLIGMGINYATDLDQHQPTRKVGVIKKAWIEGNAILVSGVIWKKDFPDAEKDLKQKDLGMSFEASDIDVVDAKADIWTLKDLCFTGAAILYKASAAYFKTEALAASAAMSAQLITTTNGGEQMAQDAKKKNKKTSVAASGEGISAAALVKALTLANKPIIDGLNALTVSNVNLANTILTAQASDVEAEALKAAKKKKGEDKDDDDDDADDDEEDDDDDDMDSAKEKDKDKEDDDDEDDEEASADDEDEIEDVGDEDDEDEEEKPGHFNKNVKGYPNDKGDKTTVSTKGDHNKATKDTIKCGTDLSSVTKAVRQLTAAREEDQETIKGLRKQLKKQTKQIEAAGERTDRKSISLSAGAAALLSKEGINYQDLAANGEKLSAAEFDACAAKSGLSINQRVAFKTELARNGIMDEGHVRRQSA
jgi:hypothetical protein